MSEHPSKDVAKHVRGYLIVGAALLFGTILTVLVSYVDLGKTLNITLALVIATFKASLVAAFFMHLISERQAIYAILLFTALFFAGLMGLVLYSMHDVPVLLPK